MCVFMCQMVEDQIMEAVSQFSCTRFEFWASNTFCWIMVDIPNPTLYVWHSEDISNPTPLACAQDSRKAWTIFNQIWKLIVNKSRSLRDSDLPSFRLSEVVTGQVTWIQVRARAEPMASDATWRSGVKVHVQSECEIQGRTFSEGWTAWLNTGRFWVKDSQGWKQPARYSEEV